MSPLPALSQPKWEPIMKSMLLEMLEMALLVFGVVAIIHTDELPFPGIGGACIAAFVFVNHRNRNVVP